MQGSSAPPCPTTKVMISLSHDEAGDSPERLGLDDPFPVEGKGVL